MPKAKKSPKPGDKDVNRLTTLKDTQIDAGIFTDKTILKEGIDDYEEELKEFTRMVGLTQDSIENDEAILDHPVKDGRATYSIDTKKMALIMLQTMVHTSGQYEGKPMYQRVGKILMVDPRLLYIWNTTERKNIEKQASTIDNAIEEFVKLKMNVIMLKLLNEIGNRDLSKMYDKNLIALLNSIYHKWRLEKGMSTQNIAVHHKVALPPPKED